jgi:hypothetical protein
MSGALDFLDLDPGVRRIDYVRAWELQRSIHAEVVA